MTTREDREAFLNENTRAFLNNLKKCRDIQRAGNKLTLIQTILNFEYWNYDEFDDEEKDCDEWNYEDYVRKQGKYSEEEEEDEEELEEEEIDERWKS